MSDVERNVANRERDQRVQLNPFEPIHYNDSLLLVGAIFLRAEVLAV